MDWSKFDLVMRDPRYLHGLPVFRDEPRMPVQAVLDSLDEGMTPEAVANAYQIDLSLVTGLQRFAESQPLAHSSVRQERCLSASIVSVRTHGAYGG